MIINAVERLSEINKDYADSICNRAKKVLGKKYFRLFNLYLENIISGEYEYIVLVTRRAYVLYELFVLCMLSEGVDIRNKVKIITSDAVCMLDYKKNINKNNKILILDDIIINGRTVLAVYNLIKDLGFTNIHIASMEKYKDSKYLTAINNLKLNNVPEVSEKIWKKDSDLLTELIVSSNIGYTSFVPTYIFNDFSVEDWNKVIEKSKQENTALELQTETFQKNEIDAYAIFLNEHFKSKLNFTSDDNAEFCIRLYYNKNENILTIVPYVFLDNIMTDNCVDFCNYFFRKYDYEINSEMKQFIQQEAHQNDKLALLYKYTICFLCKKIFNEFFVDYLNGYSKDYYLKDPYEYFCLISEDKFLQENEFSEEAIKPNEEQIVLDEDGETDYYGLSKKIFISFARINQGAQKINYKNTIIKYLNSIKNFDDQNANIVQKTTRCVGIRILDILTGLAKDDNNSEKQKILSAIIELWDEGTAAYNYMALKCKNDRYAICGFLRNGEQIYNKIYLLYKDAYSYFYRFYHKTSCYQFSILEKFALFMKERTKNDEFVELFESIKNGSEEHFYVDLVCVVPEEFCYKWDKAYEAYLKKNVYR